ncbi:MAG: HAD-IA family hydrolase, partial [Candidatus Marinimicrobia bacterium]|nr:HAD-IA family hydrolase [Candidatus Neomarinimicrobiota bacterium]
YAFPHLVDGAVYSFDVGLRKPDKEIYLTATHLANSRPENSIFIDDMESNVLAAIEVGFTGIHFKSFQQLEQDLEKLGLIKKENII